MIEDRAVEGFLKDVEPRYNASIAKIRENRADREAVHAIAGFAAYVVACSPAAMRIHTGPLDATLRSSAKALDAQGLIPKAPEALGGKSITDLLSDGVVKFTIDPKYPQAISISNILHYTSVFGNSPWEILQNCEADSAFLTSDYPAAIETFNLNTPINRIIPLAPDLAIRIKPDIRLSGTNPDLRFAGFRAMLRALKRAEVVALNRLVVQCAEDLVFYRDEQDWLPGFVKKYRRYRVEPVTHTLPHGTGDLLYSTHRIRARDQ